MPRKLNDSENMHPQVSIESQFDALVLQHPDGFVILDEQGVVLFANAAAGKLLGDDENGLPVGSTLALPPELDETGSDTIVTRGKPAISLDYRRTPVQWNGQRAYLLCVRDVTQDLRKLRHLEKLERRGRLIVAQAAEGIVVIQDGVLKFHNPMVKKVTGYSDNQLQQMPVSDLIHQEDAAVVDAFQSVPSADPADSATPRQ